MKKSKTTSKRVPPPPSYVEPVVLSKSEKWDLRMKAINDLGVTCRVKSKVTGRVGTYTEPCYTFAIPTVWVKWDIDNEIPYVTSENPLEMEIIND